MTPDDLGGFRLPDHLVPAFKEWLEQSRKELAALPPLTDEEKAEIAKWIKERRKISVGIIKI